MPITSVSSVNLYCNYSFEGTDFTEENGWNMNTFHIEGCADSTNCNKPFKIDINGHGLNDHIISTTINDLIRKGRWIWKKDLDGKAVSCIDSSGHKFELALNIKDLEGDNDTHLAGLSIAMNFIDNSGDIPVTGNDVFVLASEIKQPELECVTKFDTSGNAYVQLLLPVDFYSERKDRGYFDGIDLFVRTSLLDTNNQTSLGTSSTYINLYEDGTESSFNTVSEDGVDYNVVATIGLNNLTVSNEILNDQVLKCLQNLHITATTHSSDLNRRATCLSKEETLVCVVANVDPPKKPILKWSHVTNDFIITLPHGGVNTYSNDDGVQTRRYEVLEMNYTDGGVQQTIQLTSAEFDNDMNDTEVSYNLVDLTIFTVSDEDTKVDNNIDDYTLFIPRYESIQYSQNGTNSPLYEQDKEVLWANRNNKDHISNLYGKEVTLTRSIAYFDICSNRVLQCTEKITSNVVVPFSEYIGTDGEPSDVNNRATVESLFHRVLKNSNMLSNDEVGNARSSAPVSEVYLISMMNFNELGIGTIDYADVVFNGDDRSRFTSRANVVLTVSGETNTETLQELVQSLGIHNWEPPIQDPEAVELLFGELVESTTGGTPTAEYELKGLSSTTQYTILRTFAKLDLSVKYDVGLYSYHTKDVLGNNLLDVNCKPIMVQLEPEEITCSDEQCNGSWILDVVRYEQLNEITNVSVSINENMSTLDIQNDTDNTLELLVTWDAPSNMTHVGSLDYTVRIKDDEHVIAERIFTNESASTFSRTFSLTNEANGNPMQHIDLEDVWGSKIYAEVVANVMVEHDPSGCGPNTTYDISTRTKSDQIYALIEPKCLTTVSFEAFAELEKDNSGNIQRNYESLVDMNTNEIYVGVSGSVETIIETIHTTTSSKLYEHLTLHVTRQLGRHVLEESEEFAGYAKVKLDDDEINTVIDYSVTTELKSNEGDEGFSKRTTCSVIKVRLSKPTQLTEKDCIFVRSVDTDTVVAEVNLYDNSTKQPSHITLDNELDLFIFRGDELITPSSEPISGNNSGNTNIPLFLVRDSFSIDREIDVSQYETEKENSENTEFTFRFLPTYIYSALDLRDYTSESNVVSVYPSTEITGRYNWPTTQYTPRDVVTLPMDHLPTLGLVGTPKYTRNNPTDMDDVTMVTYIRHSEPCVYPFTQHLTNNNKDIDTAHFTVKKLSLSQQGHLTLEEIQYLNITQSPALLYKLTFTNKVDGVYAIDTQKISSSLQYQIRAVGQGNHNTYEVQSQVNITNSDFILSSNGLADCIKAEYEIVEDACGNNANANSENTDIRIRWNDKDKIEPIIQRLEAVGDVNLQRTYCVTLTDTQGNIIKSKEFRTLEYTSGPTDTGEYEYDHSVTFNNVYLSSALNQTNLEQSSNSPLLLNVTIEGTYINPSGDDMSQELQTVDFRIRVSKVPSVPCNLYLKQEDCYQDNPTARLEWSVEDDRYTTDKFIIHVTGKAKGSDVTITGSFEVLDAEFTRLNENKLFSITGKRANYSLLLFLNGESDGKGMENIKGMYTIDSYSVTRVIDTQQYTTNCAIGPMNVLRTIGTIFDDTDRVGGTTNNPLTFDFEPVVHGDIQFDNNASSATFETTYTSPSVGHVIHMFSYTIDNCTYNSVSCEELDAFNGGTLSYSVDASTLTSSGETGIHDDPDNNLGAFIQNLIDNGQAQYGIILVNRSGVTIRAHPSHASLITATDQEVNAPRIRGGFQATREFAPLPDFREKRRIELLKRFLH